MQLSKSLKKCLICGVALLTVSSIGATFQGTINANTQPTTDTTKPAQTNKQSVPATSKTSPKQANTNNGKITLNAIIPSDTDGTLQYIGNGTKITNQNIIKQIKNQMHISEDNVFQGATAKKRRAYFRFLMRLAQDKNAQYRPSLRQKVVQPSQEGTLSSILRMTHSSRYGDSFVSEPSGVTVNHNGHAYIDGRYIGVLNTDNYLNAYLETYHIQNNVTTNSETFKKPCKIAYAIRIGNIKGRDVTVLVPRYLQSRYNVLVGRHVRYLMAKLFSIQHDYNDSDVMKYGHNYGGYGARVRYWLKYYINQARKEHHVQPLQYSARLQAVTNFRTIQVSEVYKTESRYLRMLQQHFGDREIDGWVHGRNMGQSEANDSGLFDLSDFNDAEESGENAGNSNFGIGYERDLNFTRKLDNKTPRELAYNTVDNMINHDNASQNGHRKNILNPKATEGGFGVKLYRNKQGKLECTYLYDIE